jgi:hypothetical protein
MFQQGRVALAALALAFGACQPATAGTVVLLDSAGWVQGWSSLSDDFRISGSGTLTVTVKDYLFPAALGSVDVSLYNTGGPTPQLVGSMTGAGQETFRISVATATDVSAQLYAVAGGAADIGVYGWKLSFTPAPAVPLPPSAELLVGALVVAWVVVGGRRLRRRTSAA